MVPDAGSTSTALRPLADERSVRAAQIAAEASERARDLSARAWGC